MTEKYFLTLKKSRVSKYLMFIPNQTILFIYENKTSTYSPPPNINASGPPFMKKLFSPVHSNTLNSGRRVNKNDSPLPLK